MNKPELGVSEEFVRYIEGFMITSRDVQPTFIYYQAFRKFGKLTVNQLCFLASKLCLKPGWIYYKLKEQGEEHLYKQENVFPLMRKLKHYTSDGFDQIYRN